MKYLSTLELAPYYYLLRQYPDIQIFASDDPKSHEVHGPVYAQKKILKANSIFFEYYPDFDSLIKISIPGIKRGSLMLMIIHIYSGIVSFVRKSNALDLWFPAHIMILDDLKAVCDSFINNMPKTIENCLALLHRAGILRAQNDMDCILTFILSFLPEVSRIDAIPEVEHQVIKLILSSGSKVKHDPLELLTLVVNWTKTRDEEKLEQSLALLDYIPLDKVDFNSVKEILSNLKDEVKACFYGKIYSSVAVTQCPVQENVSAPTDPVPMSLETTPVEDEVLDLAAGLATLEVEEKESDGHVFFITSRKGKGEKLISHNLKTGEQLTLGTIDMKGMTRYALVYHSGFIYILGGLSEDGEEEQGKSVFIFDLGEMKWLNQDKSPKMIESRYDFQGAVVDDEIYAIGGSEPLEDGDDIMFDENINCVEKLVVNKSLNGKLKWELVDYLPKPRSDFGVTVSNGHIFVIGGHGHDDTAVASVVSYDPCHDAWSNEPSLRRPRIGLSAVTVTSQHSSFLYALGGGRLSLKNGKEMIKLDTVEVYDPSTKMWSMGPSMIKKRQFGSAVFHNDTIFVFGGDSDKQPTMEKFSLEKGQWEEVGSLPSDGYYRSVAFQP